MLLQKLKNCLSSAIFVSISTVLIFSNQSFAEQVTLGDFNGTLTTKVSSGFSVRTEDNDCKLVSGSQNTLTDAQKALIGGTPHSGNGGCNIKIYDSSGTQATKVIDIGGVNGDDGRLNFPDAGDFVDFGQSMSIGFDGRNASGIGINVSASILYNPLLDVNNAAFKALTGEAQDHLETQIELGNAYVTAPVSNNMDITVGNYVQSQGVTALFPIGVNVVNPVSLPILRSPAAELKDALLPQPMIGLTGYSDDGVTVEAYYQLSQKEVVLDSAGSFFGSELVGVGDNTGALNSPFYNELAVPFGAVYFNIVECLDGVDVYDATHGCDGLGRETDHVWATDSDGNHTDDSYKAGYDLQNTLWANSSVVLQTLTGSADIDDTLESAAAGINANWGAALTARGIGASAGAAGADDFTNATLETAFQRYYSQYPGVGNHRGLVNIFTAPKELADDDGQYGINLTGYLDDVGQGVEWGLYFNNSHSNTPRVRFLAIADGYATDMYSLLAALSSQVNYLDANSDTAATEAVVDDLEAFLGGISYGKTICEALITGAEAGTFANSTHLHDPAKCYGLANAAGANSTLETAAMGAAATLSFPGAARLQQYYPEDIQTFGGSISTVIDGMTANVEVAYRPDFPLQIDDGQLFNNIIDSTGGSMIQAFATYGAAAAAGHPSAGTAAGVLATNKWSSQPNCDLSSTTGNLSSEMSGYVECDGTAEFDVITVNANFARSLTASDPIVKNAGADGGFWLLDIGVVKVDGLNDDQGLVKSNQFYSGHDVYANGCKDAAGTSLLSFQKNTLFGSTYCEDNSGPDETSMAYKIRGGLTYNNFNNSPWTFSPSFGFNHGLGNAPTSIGGWVEDNMSASLSANFNNSSVDVGLSYVAQLGAAEDNSSADKDYLSASISYAF